MLFFFIEKKWKDLNNVIAFQIFQTSKKRFENFTHKKNCLTLEIRKVLLGIFFFTNLLAAILGIQSSSLFLTDLD